MTAPNPDQVRAGVASTPSTAFGIPTGPPPNTPPTPRETAQRLEASIRAHADRASELAEAADDLVYMSSAGIYRLATVAQAHAAAAGALALLRTRTVVETR